MKIGFLVDRDYIYSWEYNIISNANKLHDASILMSNIVSVDYKKTNLIGNFLRGIFHKLTLEIELSKEVKEKFFSKKKISLLNLDLYQIDFYIKNNRWYLDGNLNQFSDFDLIFRLGGGILSGDVLELPKYGIVGLHHGSEVDYRGGPPGFWEFMNNERYSNVILQRYDENIDAGLILDRAKISTKNRWRRNQAQLIGAGVDLSNHYLANGVNNNATIKSENSKILKNINTFPCFVDVCRYLVKAYVVGSIVSLKNIFNSRKDNFSWSISLIEKKEGVIHTRASNKTNFFADPCLVRQSDTELILFYENYSFEDGYASIYADKVSENNSNYLIKSLGEISIDGVDSHVSFPRKCYWKCFEDLYTFETISTQDNWLFEFDNKSLKFIKRYRLIFENKRHIVDPVTYTDKKGRLILLSSSNIWGTRNFNARLDSYIVDQVKSNEIYLKDYNGGLVCIDESKGRNGGILHFKNKIIRFAQVNYGHIYGRDVEAYLIEDDLDGYSEKEISMPIKITGNNAFHTVSIEGRFCAYDHS